MGTYTPFTAKAKSWSLKFWKLNGFLLRAPVVAALLTKPMNKRFGSFAGKFIGMEIDLNPVAMPYLFTVTRLRGKRILPFCNIYL